MNPKRILWSHLWAVTQVMDEQAKPSTVSDLNSPLGQGVGWLMNSWAEE